MKTQLVRSTAGLALAVSMISTAHANESNALEAVDAPVYGPTIALDETALIADFSLSDLDTDETSDESNESFSVRESDLVVPDAFLDAFDAIEGNVTSDAPVTTAPFQGPRFDNQQPKYHSGPETGEVTLRSLSPFYGDINPFYGDIDAFWGDIDAFWGDIDAFWGDINPFWGDIDAFWGDIDAFYGDIDAFDAGHLNALGNFWATTNPLMAQTQNHWGNLDFEYDDGEIEWESTYAVKQVQQGLNQLVAASSAQFGAAYTAKTGNDFQSLADEIFVRHGIDPNDRDSLAQLSAGAQSAFFLDWHDTVNLYSGVDAVDHWMATINWTPELTQIQGNGRDTIIGILDGSFSTDTDLGNNIIWAGGHDSRVGGHGAGVASLIAGAHDGEGVMGIAPDVKIATYNPFNPNAISGWDEVKNGILSMQPSGLKGANRFGRTSIINMSLGEKGWMVTQGLADVFRDSKIQKVSRDTVYVIASGNEGVTQNTDVEWYYGKDAPVTIFVGSVGPTGQISGFSNRPGSTCLLDNGVCNAGNELYMKTIVAPGEMILLSDGLGGVTRHSGTSFAAPLVSGAIALLHDRWPWLSVEPEASAEIIFRSARDLGAPGPDEVYGWGLLDVEASQSPLDFNAMTFNMYKAGNGNGGATAMTGEQLLAAGIPSNWETENVFFTGFEHVGGTYRDFSIPVSTFTYGQSTDALGRGQERFQDYVSQRFSNWINSGGSDSNGDGQAGFTELRSNGSELGNQWALRYDGMAPRFDPQGRLQMVHGAATLIAPKGQMSFTFGHGQGAMALTGYQFGIQSDHDPLTGGVNPVLGLASGQTFAQAGYKVAPNTTVRVGFSENRLDWEEVSIDNPQQALLQREFGDRPARAMTLDVEQKVNSKITVGVQYTMLDEANAVLGAQTTSQEFLGSGSQTEAMTVSASINMGSGFSVDVSATGARTETAQDQLFTNAGAVMSTAGQFSATKKGVLNRKDTLRLTVAQPLQIEQGELQFTSEQVINRDTGERGLVTQTFGIGTQRRVTTEAVYAMPVSNRADFAVFGRHVSGGDFANDAGFVLGGNFNFRF